MHYHRRYIDDTLQYESGKQWKKEWGAMSKSYKKHYF